MSEKVFVFALWQCVSDFGGCVGVGVNAMGFGSCVGDVCVCERVCL